MGSKADIGKGSKAIEDDKGDWQEFEDREEESLRHKDSEVGGNQL